MNFSRLEQQVMQDEGFRPRPYLDTEGVPTIGYGSTRLLDEPVSMDSPAISAQAARLLLRAGLFGALLDAEHLFPRIWDMNDTRQEVLVNMAYNLGRKRLGGFVRLREAADRLDYTGMAVEMQNSRWYGQVGHRADRLVEAMRSGEWG